MNFKTQTLTAQYDNFIVRYIIDHISSNTSRIERSIHYGFTDSYPSSLKKDTGDLIVFNNERHKSIYFTSLVDLCERCEAKIKSTETQRKTIPKGVKWALHLDRRIYREDVLCEVMTLSDDR